MQDMPTNPNATIWRQSAWASVALGCMCALAAVLAGLGYRWGWWGLAAGLTTIKVSGFASVAVFLLATVGCVIAFLTQTKATAAIFAMGAVLSLPTLVPTAYLSARVKTLPHIHDVSTDTDNPPPFVAVLPLRKGAKNPSTYDPKTAALQHSGYPDVRPLMLSLPPPQAFALALRTANAMGWDVVAAVPDTLRIEATATTLLFGFKDDIVIRVAAMDTGSRVDVRSLSRIGGSDFGANAGRIQSFSKKLLENTTGQAQ